MPIKGLLACCVLLFIREIVVMKNMTQNNWTKNLRNEDYHLHGLYGSVDDTYKLSIAIMQQGNRPEDN